MLTKAAAALTSKSDAFAEAMMAETAATRGWAMFNLTFAMGPGGKG
jgi:hypothetical protein